uniref:Uncharacterized protein n=1 Tax=Percolomonas cosmopolitus TaxID=63605 RepID=A0A7S1PH21_9EUKA|mmetsp:Transcript_4455/g.16814  ORF Transcript_4455/g.16814 Transcript_4455/m.16814 type:complete len:140 (+) Transcript_4455:161-580(+)
MIFILWLLVWLFSIAHPFLNGIYLITFMEYESNHISSISLCKNINMMTKIEYISHMILIAVLMIFFSETYVAIILNLPILIYHMKKFFDKSYVLDPTELYKVIRFKKNESIAKMVYYIFLFAFYLYSFIRAVIAFDQYS